MQVIVSSPEKRGPTIDSMPSFMEQITPRESQLKKLSVGNLQCSTDVKREKFKKWKLSQRSVSFYSEMEYSKRTSTQRYHPESNKQELSRFKKQAESLADINKARKNMLNWIQPDLIVTRSLMTLNRYFRREVSHAFEVIKNDGEDPELERSWLSMRDSMSQTDTKSRRIVSRFEGKKELNLYFSLDTILKKYLKKTFTNIQEYRHMNAVENFEFQIMYFNKYTQTYAHYFHPECVGTQTDEIPVFDPTDLRLKNLLDRIETKLQLAVKSGFLAILIEAQNRDIHSIENEINERQRIINRKEEWANINERKKVDAQTKFFLTFLGGFFSRKREESMLQTFTVLEQENFREKLKRIAVKNIVALSLRRLGVEFDRFRKYACEEPEKLKYDHASLMKGLFLLKASMRGIIEKIHKSTLSEIRLEGRPRSRRSIINMTRPSNMGGREDVRPNMMDRISDGGEALRYIFRKQMVENWRHFKVFYRFDEGFNQFRSKAFCIKMNNFFIRRRGFMFKLCKRNVERIDKKKKRGDASINSLDRIFKKQNLVRDAFYMIKMSRNQTAHSNHIKLGAILLNKISVAMVRRQMKQTMLEIKHDSNMGIMNIGLSIFRTGSVYRNASAMGSELNIMPPSDIQGDDGSICEDFEGAKGFTSFGKFSGMPDIELGASDSLVSPSPNRQFSLNLGKVMSLNTPGQPVKPSPRGSKFGPRENRDADSSTISKITPRQTEILNDNMELESRRSVGGDSKASNKGRRSSKFVPPSDQEQAKKQKSGFVNSARPKVSKQTEPKSATKAPNTAKR